MDSTTRSCLFDTIGGNHPLSVRFFLRTCRSAGPAYIHVRVASSLRRLSSIRAFPSCTPFLSHRCQKVKKRVEPSLKAKGSHLVMCLGCGHHFSNLHHSVSLGSGGERDESDVSPLMAKRLAPSIPPIPLALLLLLAVSSLPTAASKPVIKDDVSCTMCSSCDNPCQPAASPPPPPPSSSAECPPPPSNPGAISYYSPPPPYVYYSPPPPSSSGGGGSGGGGSYYYPPPSNRYYPAPPPPNPFLPYFPFYYYSPPPPSKYHSGSLPLKPLSSFPPPLLLLLLRLFLL